MFNRVGPTPAGGGGSLPSQIKAQGTSKLSGFFSYLFGYSFKFNDADNKSFYINKDKYYAIVGDSTGESVEKIKKVSSEIFKDPKFSKFSLLWVALRDTRVVLSEEKESSQSATSNSTIERIVASGTISLKKKEAIEAIVNNMGRILNLPSVKENQYSASLELLYDLLQDTKQPIKDTDDLLDQWLKISRPKTQKGKEDEDFFLLSEDITKILNCKYERDKGDEIRKVQMNGYINAFNKSLEP